MFTSSSSSSPAIQTNNTVITPSTMNNDYGFLLPEGHNDQNGAADDDDDDDVGVASTYYPRDDEDEEKMQEMEEGENGNSGTVESGGGGQAEEEEEEEEANVTNSNTVVSNGYAASTNEEGHASTNTNTTTTNPLEMAFPTTTTTPPTIRPEIVPMQVIYDEDAAIMNIMDENNTHTINQRQLHQQQLQGHNDSIFRKLCHYKKYRFIVFLIMTVIITGIIALSMGIHFHNNTNNDNNNINNNSSTSSSSSYPYKCYTSTADIVYAQQQYSNETVFIICPNTRIQIGTLSNSFVNDTTFINGDYPLMIIRDNITIQCGMNDGDVLSNKNKCILDGGFLQVYVSPIIPLITKNTDKDDIFTADKTDWITTPSTNNVTIHGITFTGPIMNDHVFGGSSIVISNSGNNIQFINCSWENITAPSGIFYVGTNRYQELSGMNFLQQHVVDVTISNSTFRNIIYDGPITNVWKQKLTIRGCTFDNIQLSPFIDTSCPVTDLDIWCHVQSILYCAELSICTIQDICIQNVEYSGSATIVVADNDTQLILQGLYYTTNIRLHPSDIIANGTNNKPQEFCNSGIAWHHSDQEEPECVNLNNSSNTSINNSVDVDDYYYHYKDPLGLGTITSTWKAADTCFLSHHQ